MTGKRIALLVTGFAFSSTISGCAITQAENRLALNSLDTAMKGSAITESTTGKVLAAPVALPVGVAAIAIDMALVTPARAVAPAAKDTYAYLWEHPQGSDLRRMMLLLPKAAATPVVFTTDWLLRSVFTTEF